MPKGIIKDYNMINQKNFYNQTTDPEIKRSEEIRKLSTGQSKNYSTGYSLNYHNIRNHYKLMAMIWVDKKN